MGVSPGEERHWMRGALLGQKREPWVQEPTAGAETRRPGSEVPRSKGPTSMQTKVGSRVKNPPVRVRAKCAGSTVSERDLASLRCARGRGSVSCFAERVLQEATGPST